MQDDESGRSLLLFNLWWAFFAPGGEANRGGPKRRSAACRASQEAGGGRVPCPPSRGRRQGQGSPGTSRGWERGGRLGGGRWASIRWRASELEQVSSPGSRPVRRGRAAHTSGVRVRRSPWRG